MVSYNNTNCRWKFRESFIVSHAESQAAIGPLLLQPYGVIIIGDDV